ncbi:MAG: DUF1015 domain-containing protein [Lachnospiraceae bacterium]|nr:DUF1015 domain-containing protein [Lachnospiraceae bacterium]
MADIRPFMAVRPNKEYASDIAALPYDVYSSAEAREEVKGKPNTFLRIDRAETNFDEGIDIYDKKVYEKAASILNEMISDGRFIKDNKPCYYIYELTMDGRVQTGIVAASSIDDYDNNIIKKHENTLAAKEQDRINHINVCSAQTGPIFLAYRDRSEVDKIVDKVVSGSAEYDFVSEDDVRHRVFLIDNEDDINTLRQEFSDTDSIYIADGHHRAASAVKVGKMRREAKGNYTGEEEFNYFLSVLFPDNQLMIMDYNRVLKDMNGHSIDELYSELERYFTFSRESESPIKPDKKGGVSLYDGSKWRLYNIKDEYTSNDPVKGLDVSLLQELILQPFFGIDDPKTDNRIDFVGGIRGLKELERRCKTDCKVAFAMYPTDISELFDVADAKRLMPPKSTWFEPKLRSGLFIHEIEK